MAKGVNKVILVGNLGRDPESRFLPNNTAVCNVTVATSSSKKDKDSGQWQDVTEWHKVTFYDRLAETAGKYLKKGAKVYIEGRLQTRSYEKDGQKHYVTEIIANEMQMLDSRGGGSPDGGAGFDQGFDQPAAAPRSRPASAPASAPAPAPAARNNDFDDDIPF